MLTTVATLDPGVNMVNQAIWRKIHCQERVAASVTGPQFMLLFFVRLSQTESLQSFAKKIGGSQILLNERNRKHPGSNIQKNFFEFPKKVRIIDFGWWRSY
jgi:hypothetical protein